MSKTREECNNSMRLESYDLCTFARQLYEINAEEIYESITRAEAVMPRKIFAAGCGDSYCAALAAQEAFRKLTGLPMFGTQAIDVSRCMDGEDFDNILFYGISSRGMTSRVVEAAKRVNEISKKAKTFAIVNFLVENSQLEAECDGSLHIKMPVFECGEYTEHAPCQRSYFSTTFTLMLLAIRIGELRGNYSSAQADEYRESMMQYAEKFTKELLEPMDLRMWELAQRWNDFSSFEVVGSGPDEATTWFVAAKFVEAFGDCACFDTPDNWLRVNANAKDPEKIGTVVILDKDNGALEETVAAIEKMIEFGRPVIVFTDAEEDIIPDGAEVFRLPSPEYHWAKPLMQYCPIGFLCGYIKEMRGVPFYRRGDAEHAAMRVNFGDVISNQPLRVIE
ncbi:MAG: SIS domain-containing protein [Oscillospiraceae bacterium]|nr:SIS domain-containing protein [Oscillospiraceae bacterium]